MRHRPLNGFGKSRWQSRRPLTELIRQLPAGILLQIAAFLIFSAEQRYIAQPLQAISNTHSILQQPIATERIVVQLFSFVYFLLLISIIHHNRY